MTETTRYRLALLEAGFQPTAVRGKDALVPGWTNPHTAEEIAGWPERFPALVGTGYQTRDVPTADIDVTHPEAATTAEGVIRDMFDGRGEILVRFGRAPKRSIPFRTTRPFRKLRIDFLAPDGSKHHIEFLGDGQQVVCNGVHPETRKAYAWVGDREPGVVRRESLPEIDEEEASALLALIAERLLEEHGFKVDTGKTNGHDRGADSSDRAAGMAREAVDVEAALAKIHYGAIHDTWKDCVGSLLRAGMLANDAFRKVLQATEGSADCQADPKREGWRTGLAKLVSWFLQTDPTLVASLPPALQPQWFEKIREGKTPQLFWRGEELHVRKAKNDKPQEEAKTASSSAKPAEGTAQETPRQEAPRKAIEARPFQRFDPAKIPPREWLYNHHYQRGIITATVGPGGGGKSSLDLVELIAMCTGRNLLGEQPKLRCRAWYHNAEDGLDEIYRRIAAVCQHYGIDQSELAGWLYVTSGIEMPIKFATSKSGKVSIDAITTAAITRTILDNEIGVSSFDPLVAHHTAVENATGDMDQVCRELARIANATDCAIEVVHHTRKPARGQEELSVMDSRGAGAIINAVRSARVLNAMSKGEADKAGVDDIERQLHFRIDNGKRNMAPPSAARWHKFIGVDLPNGDNVGVVTPWTFPTAAGADIGDTACMQIQTLVATHDYRVNAQSPDWVGHAVAHVFRLDATTKSGRAAIGRYLAALFTRSVIAVSEGKTGGHKVKTVIVGTWRPAP